MNASARRSVRDSADPGAGPLRGPQALWPFVAQDAGTVVQLWDEHAPATSVHALLLAGPGLHRERDALFRQAIQAHVCLVPGGGVALLADNPWRTVVRGRFGAGPGWPTMWQALHQAGFECLRLYAVMPSAANPYAMQPAGALAASLAPAVLLSASRRGTSAMHRTLDSLPMYLCAAGVVPARSRIRRILCSGKNKTIVFLGAKHSRWVARLPWSPQSQDAERRAHHVLRQLVQRPVLAPMLPQPVHHGVVNGQDVMVETLLPGRPLAALLTPANREHFGAQAGAFLAELNPADCALGGDLMKRFGQPLLDSVAPHLPDPSMLATLHSILRDALDGVRCRVGLVHGDFGTRNILVEGQRITGVIDWENARIEAPLIFDVMNYLDSAQRRVERGQTLLDTIPMLASGRWPHLVEAALLQRELAAGHVDQRGRHGLAILFWLNHVGPQLSLSGRDGVDRSRFLSVLEWVLCQSLQRTNFGTELNTIQSVR
jgi:aminoglycoside phosphotransferase (APT) family kinase protein